MTVYSSISNCIYVNIKDHEFVAGMIAIADLTVCC